MRIERIIMTLAGCLFLFAEGVQAQNLVPNPRFDQNLSGWLLQPGNAVWDSADAGGSSTSGSLLAVPPADGVLAGALSGCFRATPGAYDLEFKHYEPESGPGTVTVFLRWYSDDSCTVLHGNSPSLISFYHGQSWETISSSNWGVDLIAPAGTRGAAVQILAGTRAYFDDVVVRRQGSCASESCLNNGRFAVDIRWQVGNESGQGQPMHITSDSGFYWFFDPNNAELVVKVLNGCARNNHYWVFMAGLTNVRVEVTVTDVATGVTRTYVNLERQAFAPIQDTTAFATCP